MDCQKPKSFLFSGLATGFLLLLCGNTGPLLGQDSDLSLETLLERIEKLEADNKRLQQRVGPIDLEDAETADSVAAESEVEQTAFSGPSTRHPKG